MAPSRTRPSHVVDGPATVVDFVPGARIVVAMRGLHAEEIAKAVTNARRGRRVPAVVRRLHNVGGLCARTHQSRRSAVNNALNTYVVATGVMTEVDHLRLAVVPRVGARRRMRATVGAGSMRRVAAMVARRAVVARARAARAAVAVVVWGARGVDWRVVLPRARLRVLRVAVRGVVDLGLRLGIRHGMGTRALVAVGGDVVGRHGCGLECGSG